jgi:hypothetical protein
MAQVGALRLGLRSATLLGIAMKAPRRVTLTLVVTLCKDERRLELFHPVKRLNGLPMQGVYCGVLCGSL